MSEPARRWKAFIPALAAPALFGSGVAASKALLGGVDPVLMAGGLYLGSGLGLAALLAVSGRGRGAAEAPLRREDLPWLAGAVAAGGVAGPCLLMLGLAAIPANSASLLLNLEAALTALVAGLVFRESIGARAGLGIALVAAGGGVLAWEATAWPGGASWGALAVAGACLCWAVDNNLSQRVSGKDPVQIAAMKGVAAGAFNTALALALGAGLPGPGQLAAMFLVGLLGYGASLVCFMRSLRELGAARTGMFFALAPFIGAAAGVLFLGEAVTAWFALAAALMVAGVWLGAGGRHEHWHAHAELHEHRHAHDEHHGHAHGPDAPPGPEHSHPHSHAGTAHSHPHEPDIHHRDH